MKPKILMILLGVLVAAACSNNENEKEKIIKDSTNQSAKLNIPDSTINKIHVCTQLPGKTTLSPKAGAKGAGTQIYFMWPRDVQVLTVSFLDGDPIVQKKVQEFAKEWEQHCGIRFDFGVHQNPDISISFKYSGSWSWIGKSSKQHYPSMNFGWLYPTTENSEYSRVVLHEFGHALGLIHEHQNPNGNPIKWNTLMVYEYFRRTQPDWNDKDIDNNIFAKYSKDEINGTDFDPHSIMLYSFPKELTLDNYSTDWNTKLSEGDIYFIEKMYPLR